MIIRKSIRPLFLLFLCVNCSAQAAPPHENYEVEMISGHKLKLWFNPKYGWRAKSYDQRYQGCTRYQEHRVYTADDAVLSDLLKNPNNLHWLSDPDEAGKQALYLGSLGLPGGMPSRRAIEASGRDLKRIVEEASKGDKMLRLQRALAGAKKDADFSEVYELVFGADSSDQEDLTIFDLSVGEVKELPGYKALVLRPAAEEKEADLEGRSVVQAEDADASLVRSAELVEALYAPVDSEKYQAACRVLKLNKYEAECSKILPLTAGLLYQKFLDGQDGEAYGLHTFWHHMLSNPRELVDIHQVMLNMRCMESCKADDQGVLENLHKPILEQIMAWLLGACQVSLDVDLSGTYPITVPLSTLEDLSGTCPHVLAYEPLTESLLSRLQKPTENSQVSKQTVVRILVAARELPKAVETGKLSVEALCGLCKDESCYVRQAAAEGLSKVLEGKSSEDQVKSALACLRDLCKDEDSNIREAAANGLSKAMQQEKLSLEALIGLCKDRSWYVREAATGALSKALEIGKVSLEVLYGLCKDESECLREAVAVVLSTALETMLSENQENAIIRTLYDLCRDRYPWVRRAAAAGLAKVLEVDKLPLEALSSLCKDADWHVRSVTAREFSKALEGRLSEGKVNSVVEALCDLCKDGDHVTRRAAAEGLAKALEVDNLPEVSLRSVLATLIRLRKDKSEYVRSAAAEGFSKAVEVGKVSKVQVKSIAEALYDLCRDQYPWVRRTAARGLTQAVALENFSESQLHTALDVLTGLCKDQDARVRSAAGAGLSQAAEAGKLSLKALCDLCKDKSKHVRYAAAEALSNALGIGKLSLEALCSLCVAGELSETQLKSLVEALVSLCKDKSAHVRHAAVESRSKC